MEWQECDYYDKWVKEICYNCNSSTAKASYNYFRRLMYDSGNKIWCKVWSKGGQPIAFYCATRNKDRVRLVEIVVRSEYQHQGIGKKLLFALLKRMKDDGVLTLSFRTPINESAPDFWLHMGAKITGLKGEDYEMEIKLK